MHRALAHTTAAAVSSVAGLSRSAFIAASAAALPRRAPAAIFASCHCAAGTAIRVVSTSTVTRSADAAATDANTAPPSPSSAASSSLASAASAAASSAVSEASNSGSGCGSGGVSSLSPELSTLARGVLSGDRLSLSRAITLIESTHPRHILQAQQLLAALAHERQHKNATASASAITPAAAAPAEATAATPASAAADPQQQRKTAADEEAFLRAPRSLRIGISGPPGVGKSSFIEALGRYLLSLGHKLAVLSIDPSSHVSGGSILGDKTRMAELARHPHAYVRPSPSKCVLGGVAAATYDTLLLCEHAGFSLVLVETVGVGQSEVSVHAMVDLLVLLAQPGGGDELQGMKKGLVELIDLVVVNKADGALRDAARHTKLDFVHALQLNTRRKKDTDWKPLVKLCSSINQVQGMSQSVHPAPHDRTEAEAAELGSALTSSSPVSSSATSRQAEQLRSIWHAMCSFDTWARGVHGDLHVRRAQQANLLLRQALTDNIAARVQHGLTHLDSFQLVQKQLQAQAQAQRRQLGGGGGGGDNSSSATSAATSTAADAAAAPAPAPATAEVVEEVIPRVAAQRIVDEWIRREAEHLMRGATSSSSAGPEQQR